MYVFYRRSFFSDQFFSRTKKNVELYQRSTLDSVEYPF
jgi:hypothetical protein